jgi:anti-sigma factor RsiW
MWNVVKMSKPTDGCIATPELVDYFDGLLPFERQWEIEEHLAGCLACTARARMVRSFLEKWLQLSATRHGAAYWSDRAEAALQSLSTSGVPDWALRRLRTWARRWRGAAEIAVLLEGGALPGIETVKSLVRSGSPVHLSPVSAGIRVRGTPENGVKSVAVEAQAQHRRVELTVTEASQRVGVTVGGLTPGKPVPLVVLVPLDEGSSPVLLQMKPEPGMRQFTAHLRDVRPGAYLLLVEPSPEAAEDA